MSLSHQRSAAHMNSAPALYRKECSNKARKAREAGKDGIKGNGPLNAEGSPKI
jgi:hypothetical protein